MGIGVRVAAPLIAAAGKPVAQGGGGSSRLTPYLITDGFRTSGTAAPVIPVGIANGDLAVAALLRTGSSAPVLPAGWTGWVAPFSAAPASGILCWQVVAGGTLAWPDFINNSGRRLLWVFRDAEPSAYAGGAIDLSSTSCDWRGLNDGNPFAIDQLVVGAVHFTISQTNTGGKVPLALTERAENETGQAFATGDTAGTLGDAGTVTLLSSYAAEARGPIDTAAAKVFVEFAVQGKLAA